VDESSASPGGPVFAERPTELVVRDALPFGALALALAGAAGLLGWTDVGWAMLAVTAFVACFFRNPHREVPADERSAVAPADGKVIEVGEIERADGSKAPRVGIFLSIFDVHVNRSPVAGRVVSVERAGRRFLAAFDRRAEAENARCTLALETAGGARVEVVQIAGLVARRIVCHPRPGEWLRRGARYGLIRFGSRTDVVLPAGSELRVRRGERVRGGESVIAMLPEAAVAGGAP
jgi:phosphatidylserine decarboxylase